MPKLTRASIYPIPRPATKSDIRKLVTYHYPKLIQSRAGVSDIPAITGFLWNIVKKNVGGVYPTLEAANITLNLFGVEVVMACNLDGEHYLRYVNAGDTYTLTLYHYRGHYRVGDWGTMVERYMD